MGEIRTLVVDDSAQMRKAIVEVLQTSCGCDVVGEGANGLEALELARARRPSLVVMDIEMPLLDGLSALRLLTRELPRTKIVLVSSILDPDIRNEALDVGALACLEKGGDLWDQLPAIVSQLSQDSVS